MRFKSTIACVSAAALALSGCGGGGGNGGSTTPVVTPPPPPPTGPVRVFADPPPESLSTADVQQVIAQAVAEAQARNVGAAIVVVDRVGNPLAAFRMNNAPTSLSIPQLTTPVARTLPGTVLNNAAAPVGAALAKAITGAYLSSAGNAFSTRTASQIVQQNFAPGNIFVGLESGPLYGVQFSSLPCSDLVARFNSAAGSGSLYVDPATGTPTSTSASIGPRRTPLGLAADAGGFPLYKNGTLVGGIGVLSDGVYGFDKDIRDFDKENDEFIAIAGTRNFDAPVGIRANRITVDGTQLRYSDVEVSELRATSTPSFASINGSVGSLLAVPGYTPASITGVGSGTAYGTESSGIRQSSAADFTNRDIYVLSDGNGNNRFPIRGGTDGSFVTQPLTSAETRALLEEAFKIMSRARAQIRQPLDSPAQVSFSVVDTNGSILGVIRSPDAPIFGIDVSLQKARTAAFFSNPRAAADISANGTPEVVNRLALSRAFFNDPNIFTGQTAFPNRAIGNIARPFFPDGEQRRPPGPLSPGIDSFSPFHTGIQSELIFDNVLQHVGFVLSGGISPDTPQRCTQSPDAVPGQNRLQNGIQIFPGSVPVYRGNVLVGAIGISGDGIDQDDMISFLGTNNAGVRVNTGIGNAPFAVRSDQIVVQIANPSAGVRLRYVGCPFAPFLDTREDNVCQGR